MTYDRSMVFSWFFGFLKTDWHDEAEKLLKVVLTTIILTSIKRTIFMLVSTVANYTKHHCFTLFVDVQILFINYSGCNSLLNLYFNNCAVIIACN